MTLSIPHAPHKPRFGAVRRHEILESHPAARETYSGILEMLDELPRPELQRLDEGLEAVLREMGTTFALPGDPHKGWLCNILPHVFDPGEWALLEKGFQQRLRAFEAFLRDIYGPRQILLDGQIPVQPVLSSPYFQRATVGLPAPDDAFLHLSGICLARPKNGPHAVKHHYFSSASGISYMMQNRRALAQTVPQFFHDFAVTPIADVPIEMLEVFQALSDERDPTIVLLSSGQASAVYSEHAFLARRMGIPLVQGADLLVLNDRVYLKTVTGLEKVDVIYTRVADMWLDPLAFGRDGVGGVPGLVHCIRRQTVRVVNMVGSQLADDRSLLCFAPQIIRYYLNESPILPALPTYWMGDIDQREIVFAQLDDFTIRPVYGERWLTPEPGAPFPEELKRSVISEVAANPAGYVAQPNGSNAVTFCYEEGKRVERLTDHILFALRVGEGDYRVFPGALTRVSTTKTAHTANELGGGSKDSWVPAFEEAELTVSSARRPSDDIPLPQPISSRVAESFYWIGRYLERAYGLAAMIGVVEALETEELNATERTLYRPVWNRLLPPLESPGKSSRRNVSTAAGRYRLCLAPDEPDSVISAIRKAAGNAESILEGLSADAWNSLEGLRSGFDRVRFREDLSAAQCTRVTRRLCPFVAMGVPQFFGVAEATMVMDGGWRFCEIGRMVERAVIIANAVCSMMEVLPTKSADPSGWEHVREIELSVFLRLLNTRDAYRRIYQSRAEAGAVLELLWNNPSVPRSVAFALDGIVVMLKHSQPESSLALQKTLAFIGSLKERLEAAQWEDLLQSNNALTEALGTFLCDILEIHHLISDGFLNHQIHMQPPEQPLLPAFPNAL